MPDLKTHYAMMNAQEECVSRPLPVGVVVYHLYLKLVHSGMTMDEVLSMDDEHFGQFLSQGFQINCSAGIFPYEKDFVPGLCLSFFEGLTLGPVPTEDMVSSLSLSRHAHKIFIILMAFFVAGLAAVHGAAGGQDIARHQAHQGQRGNDHGPAGGAL
jgi:hypothetical protein